MGTWLNIATWWTCTIVTVVGLLLSFVAWHKKGARSGMRGIAWSLLPIAMYLTHAIALVGHLGAAIASFGTAFVFSPKAWLGVVLVGISAVLFLISGGIPLLSGDRERRATARQDSKLAKRDASGDRAGPVRPTGRQPDVPPSEDLGDVQEILRRHGIK